MCHTLSESNFAGSLADDRQSITWTLEAFARGPLARARYVEGSALHRVVWLGEEKAEIVMVAC